MFLYIDPLKQGLKPIQLGHSYYPPFVFIHRSIKTRIETESECFLLDKFLWFLYIDPLKQGLKQKRLWMLNHELIVFIHRSIKTRIETLD